MLSGLDTPAILLRARQHQHRDRLSVTAEARRSDNVLGHPYTMHSVEALRVWHEAVAAAMAALEAELRLNSDFRNTMVACAADKLSKTLLMFDAFHDVEAKARAGNTHAERVMRSWAEAEWFTSRPEVPEKSTFTTFQVTGETNTDDLSPAPDAWSRPDIPLHALAMLKNPREGITDAPAQIEALKQKGHQIAYVGDVVGTGSSRKSATNSVLGFMGDDIPNVPNKRTGGLCIGGKIAPIFSDTLEDSGALPTEMAAPTMPLRAAAPVSPAHHLAKRPGRHAPFARFRVGAGGRGRGGIRARYQGD